MSFHPFADERALPVRTEKLVRDLPEIRHLRERAGEQAREGERLYRLNQALSEYVFHSDEKRAVGYISEERHAPSRRVGRYAFVRTAAYHRGMREAQTDGVLWTPLLDELASREAWPEESAMDFRWSDDGPPVYSLRTPDGEVERRTFFHPHEIVGHLAGPVEAVQDADVIRRLLRFRYVRVWEIVARHTRCLDEPLMQKLVDALPTLGVEIAQNDSLTRDQIDWLVNWAVESLAHRKANDVDDLQMDVPLNDPAFGTGPEAEALIHLYHRYPELMSEVQTLELFGIALRHDPAAQWGRRVGVDGSAGAQAQAVLVNMSREQLSPADLHALYDMAPNNEWLVQRVVQNAGADVSVWRHIADHCHFVSVQKALATHPEARKDGTVRKSLEDKGDLGVLRVLLSSAQGAEFRRLFRGLVARDQAMGLRVITNATRAQQKTTVAEDYLPILASASGEDREALILLLGRLNLTPKSKAVSVP